MKTLLNIIVGASSIGSFILAIADSLNIVDVSFNPLLYIAGGMFLGLVVNIKSNETKEQCVRRVYWNHKFFSVTLFIIPPAAYIYYIYWGIKNFSDFDPQGGQVGLFFGFIFGWVPVLILWYFFALLSDELEPNWKMYDAEHIFVKRKIKEEADDDLDGSV